ncbi:GNAT family N-acetyltransferase [Sandarakinorhabdus cyanobacteriorum]|uniref:GNAT family N-acetyltransferase n=1 Tax=Sandarakinorhabdus cyanobacteriorum TaxID=1981098 RepID=A0A255Z6U9_9SPHN|nr:GNAT family N-acetyltransferase [Sandarakinorhabdus cyanobacteriorum]OYQ36360.1 GNAT family N-acetyltransferase [Sandarakinorhabdus cyanobacteriorum]
MSIRPARMEDAAALAAIYAPAVLHGTASFELEPPSAAEMAQRLMRVKSHGWPWLVHVTMGQIDGYAYATQFRDRAAYRYCGETSVYVAPDAQRTGIGQALLMALASEARAAGFRELIAVIGDSANEASIGLHANCGFRPAGVLQGIGEKFGRRLDIVMMQRSLS